MLTYPIQKDISDLVASLSEYQDFVWLDSADNSGISILAFGSKDSKTFDEKTPISEFNSFLNDRPKKQESAYPFLFTGGWIGYLSYETFQFNSLIPFKPKHKKAYPLAQFFYYDSFIYIDHSLNETYFVSFSKNAEQDLNRFLSLTNKTRYKKKSINSHSQFTPSTTKQKYELDFNNIKKSLLDGSYFELNYSMEYQKEFYGNALDLYLNLRSVTKAPMMAYFDLPDLKIMSSSPERFFEMNNQHIKTFPIKGTIKRGRTPVEDEANKVELINSQKDQAELLMVIDMLRSDLGRICQTGSVKVNDLARIKTFSHYHHLIASISGDLLPNHKLSDVFEALFPGGSITGAPKIQVMKHIEQLENRARGIYTGAMGYISNNGRIDFNIPIRTLTLEENQLSFATGSGIVADSECLKEFNECKIKASGILESLRPHKKL